MASSGSVEERGFGTRAQPSAKQSQEAGVVSVLPSLCHSSYQKTQKQYHKLSLLVSVEPAMCSFSGAGLNISLELKLYSLRHTFPDGFIWYMIVSLFK